MPVHNSPLLLSLGDIIFSASFLPATVFLLYYGTRAKWWQTPVGRMFVISQVSLLLVSIVVILSLTFGPDYPGRDIFRIVAYSAHFLAQVIVLLTYFRVRHEKKSPIPKTKDDIREMESRS